MIEIIIQTNKKFQNILIQLKSVIFIEKIKFFFVKEFSLTAAYKENVDLTHL